MSEVFSLGDVVRPNRPRVKPETMPDAPFIGMEHVEAHTMKLLGTVPAATMKSSAVHFKPGDVLYGRLRPYLNKVFRPTFEGLCSAEFIVLPENERIHGRYLQYFLNSGTLFGLQHISMRVTVLESISIKSHRTRFQCRPWSASAKSSPNSKNSSPA